MTHDPLCSWWSIQCDSDCAELPYGSSCKHMFCVCDLIAKVRADEKAKWTHVCPDNNCCHQSGD